jgi:glycosyltransferase involved in cell wall biosynthesis
MSKTNHAELSILLATHNGACWLPALLGSLAVQTLTPARIVILDDASTDGTWDLVRDIRLPGVQVFSEHQEANAGVLPTFGRLLSMVETEYFALCDQDDVWLPDKLEKSVRLLQASGADLAYTDLRVVDEDLHELAPSMWRMSGIAPATGHPVIPLIIKNSVTGCTVIGRTAMLKRALPLPPGIPMHDWWLGLVAACGNGVVPLHEATILYRQHQHNEIGAAQFGYRGLQARLDRRGVPLGAYLRDRLASRLALIDSLQERQLVGRRCFLAWFYRRSLLLRFLLNPVYLAYTVTHAGVLGFRNLAVDWLLTCAPIPIGRVRGSA